jgi:crotonobetainyl-CoA:carnitine CoA-transferase CaiB-like acyl-CoA transferase
MEVARQLALKVDVIVESFRPGVMDRLGLGREALRRENAGLVYCSVTGFGESGPNVDLPAGDSIMQAYGGLMSIIGERDGDPLRVGNVVSDMLAGTNAFSGVVLALLTRAVTGKGGDVRVSLLDSIVAFQAPPLTEFLLTGKTPRRLGNEHPLIAPSGAVRTKDGQINYTVFDHQWPDFCAKLGLPRLASDARFANSGLRQQNRDPLNRELAMVFAKRSSGEWIKALRQMDVLCAPINDYAALVADSQVRHNAIVDSVEDAAQRAIPMLRNPVRIDSHRTRLTAPPRLGEHTGEILRSELGFDDARITRFISAGIAMDASAADLATT